MRADLLKGRSARYGEITEVLWEVPEEKVSDDELVKEMHLAEFIERYIHKYEVVVRYLEKTSLQGRARGLGSIRRASSRLAGEILFRKATEGLIGSCWENYMSGSGTGFVYIDIITN